VDVPLDDVERIEIIRGPGATMWGANAVNGVINIITGPAGRTPGTRVSLATGTEDRAAASVRHGGTAGDGLDWRIWGTAFDRGPLARAGGGNAHDGWRVGRTGFRADYRASDIDDVTVQGDVHAGRVDQTSADVQLSAPYRQLFDERAHISGRNVLARWTRTRSPQSATTVQLFADHTDRREHLLGQRRTTVDVDVQHRQSAGARHDLVWGLGFRRGRTRLTNSTLVHFADTDRGDWLASAFAEDEIAVVPERLALTLGLKVERNGYSGVELQPNVRGLWSVSDRDSIWGAITRGVRTPSLLENGATVAVASAPGPQGLPLVVTVIGRGTPDIEELWAAEMGYRRHWSRLSIDVSAFRNRYSNGTSLTPGTPELVLEQQPYLRMPYLIDAALHGSAYGVEAATTWRAARGWTLTAGYSFLRVDLTSGGIEQNIRYEDAEGHTPRHQLVLRSLGSIGRRWEVDATLHARSAFDAGKIPALARVDLRGGWKVSDRLTVSVAGVNLLDARQFEFLSVLNEELTQPRRGVLLQTRWTF
jgi:iron complex outermembrane receptor protein